MIDLLSMEPMKYWAPPSTIKNRKLRITEALTNGEYFAMVKRDGAWYRYVKDFNGENYLQSRTESRKEDGYVQKQASVPHIISFLNQYLPSGTVLLGEIGYPKGKSRDVTTVMGCLPEKAIERQKKKGLLHYYVFDILFYDGKDMRDTQAIERAMFLKQLFAHISEETGIPEYIERAEFYTENLPELVQKVLDDGEEGVVLYKKTGKYECGKRTSWLTIKIKKELNEVDAICIGFEEPTKIYTGQEIDTWSYWEDGFGNKITLPGSEAAHNYCLLGETGVYPVTKPYYMGWCGALRIGVIKGNDIVPIGTVSSGLTDSIREKISKCPEDYFNKPVLLKAMEVDKNALRHPVFIMFRDDIPVEDCTYSKIWG